ncbi:MAG: LysM peptidoglycan-binding domain-containing protein [Bacteroidia bacterium]
MFVVKGVFSQPEPTAAFPFTMTVEQYVEKYSAVAVEEMHKNHIPASITLAQGLLESGNGNSRLAKEGNNHFGIKCKDDWKGETIKEDDDAPQECFRKYKDAFDSYHDHSEFLKNGKRYAFLFDLNEKDYKSWAKGLKKAGYATNPKYADILVTTIENNNLARFDSLKPGQAEEKKIVEEKKVELALQRNVVVNGIPALVAKRKESYAEIALENDMRVWQIYKYNDLTKDAELKEGDTIFLKPKNYKGTQEFYVVTGNESMHLISQRFGIKLSRLLHKNGMNPGDEPAKEETVFLRDYRKEKIKLRTTATARMRDSVYNNIVYDDANKNIETQKPVLPEDKFAINIPDNKDDMAFLHFIQKGETLFSISKKYNVQVEGIRQLNKLRDNTIHAGMQLIINPNQPPVNEKEDAVVPGYHFVKQGETLYSIARRYNISVLELQALNDLKSDTVRIGDELVVVPLNGEKPKEENLPNNNEPVFHLVKEKETMYSLSRKYNVSKEQIRSMNNLLDNDIKVGQRLRIR